MYSRGPLHMDEQRQDDQLESTYSTSVPIRDEALRTCLRRWMLERGGERRSRISVLIAWHDDDDDVYICILCMCIYVYYIYIYICVCVCVYIKYVCKTLPSKCPGYDTKQSDGETPVMLELWKTRSTPSLPSLPAPVSPGVVISDRVVSICQIEDVYYVCVFDPSQQMSWIWHKEIWWRGTSILLPKQPIVA